MFNLICSLYSTLHITDSSTKWTTTIRMLTWVRLKSAKVIWLLETITLSFPMDVSRTSTTTSMATLDLLPMFNTKENPITITIIAIISTDRADTSTDQQQQFTTVVTEPATTRNPQFPITSLDTTKTITLYLSRAVVHSLKRRCYRYYCVI